MISFKKLSLSGFLEALTNYCLYLTVLLVPIWFLPVTLDVLELNKQTLLVILMMIALITWLGRSILRREFKLSRSWIHIVVTLFAVGYLVTSLFSQDRYLSLVGNFGQMQWAFSTVMAFVVMYLLIVNVVRDTARLYSLLLTFLASSLIAGLFGLLQVLNVFSLAWLMPGTGVNSFNSVGTINSLAMYLTVPMVMAASLLVLGCKNETCVLGKNGKRSVVAKALVWAMLTVGFIYSVLVDFWVTWAALLFGTLLVVLISWIRTKSISRPIKLIAPGVLCIVAVILLIWPTPIKLSLPAEVSPSLGHSWQIARQVLQNSPLFGSGPGTWIYDYSQYRAPVVNLSQFWTVRFERGLSTFFSLIAMVGLVGVSLWLILILSAIVKSATHLTKEKNDDEWQAYLTVFAGWATTVFIAFFYNYNLSHHFVFWFLLALLAALVAKGEFVWDGTRKPTITTVLSIVFIILSVGAVSVAWLAGQRLVADANYSKSVTAFRGGKPIQESIDNLNTAVALNRLNDVYYRNLSQAYLIRVGQELQQQPDQEKAQIVNNLVSASIDTAKKATEISPANVDNWANLGVVYQAIASFTRGADEFAIKAYEEALKREPNNPLFYNEIGKLHVLRSDAYRTLLSSTDETVKKDAENNIRTELDASAAALNQAIQAKSDYAPAHYNLGIMYERQGRIKDAITKLEQVLSVNGKDVGVGFQLAILYYRNGEKDKAADLLEQIVRLEPQYANARWYLSALYEEQGRIDDSLAQIKEIIKTNPDNQTVTDRLNYLTQLKNSKTKPVIQPIPEPIKEEIKGPQPLNEVKKP
ncbi:MAG: tetratricopeptide repeat protein [Patescibacteria group bacterium]